MSNNWKIWCRLCANEHPSNIDINLIPQHSNLTDALNHFFSINISDADDWGSMICLKCRETMNQMIEFGNKVSRVQTMFLELLNCNAELDVKQLKAQYKLDDEFEEEKPIELPLIDKLFEPQISKLNSLKTEIDLPEIPDIKMETSDEECSEDFAADLETPNDNKRSKKEEKPNITNTEAECPECEKIYPNVRSMRRHLKKQHEIIIKTPSKGPYICENCGKIYKSQGKLDEHKLIYIEDRPFKCEQCGKSFKNLTRLKYHEDTHSTTSYICTICGVQLNSRATLNRHMVVHSDQKHHKCDYCGNEYKRAKALKAHLILHTGLKPYKCDFCERTFANGSNCRNHKKKSHPIQLAEMEAAGKVSIRTKVPELKDLRDLLSSTVGKIKDLRGTLASTGEGIHNDKQTNLA